MRHRLFTALAALSLLLGVGLCVLRARSYRMRDEAAWWRPGGVGRVQSVQGCAVLELRRYRWWGAVVPWTGLRYEHEKLSPLGPVNPMAWMYVLNVDRGDTFVTWEHLGFGWYWWQSRDGNNLIGAAVVPYWFPASLAALLPLWWVVGWWRSRGRPRLNLCRKCGYDLRATPERCPECGTVARKVPAPARDPT